MAAKTSTQRQKEHKTRMKQAGLVRLELWVHPSDKEDVRRYAMLLQHKHLTKTPNM